jgi:von Willebrand factor type A domain
MYGSNQPSTPGVIDQLSTKYHIATSWLHSITWPDTQNMWIGLILFAVMAGLSGLALKRYLAVRKQYGDKRLVDDNPGTQRMTPATELFRFGLRMLVPLSLVLALLNPYLPGMPHRVPSSNIDYAVCIQDSRGMGAIDVPPHQYGQGPQVQAQPGFNQPTYSDDQVVGVNPDGAKGPTGNSQFFHEHGSRLDLVRNVMRDLVKGPLLGSQVSLIAFQGVANVLVPLTDSEDWLLDTLDPNNKYGLRVAVSAPLGDGNVDGKVSTIAACLQAAHKELKEHGNPNHKKYIIYFGNGDDISDDQWLADEEKQLAADGIRGFIFGVGGAPIPIPQYTGDNEQFAGYYKFLDGTEAQSGYNEANLQKLQAATGWAYYHLDPRSMPKMDFFIQSLTDSKIEIGKLPIFDYLLYIALGLITIFAIEDWLVLAVLGLVRMFKRRTR